MNAGRMRFDTLAAAPPTSVTLEEVRLARPFRHSGIVSRRHILDRIEQAQPWTVLSVVAPAGSGKSILLSQWAEQQRGPTAWVRMDHDDDDPTVLLHYVATALDRVVDLDPRLLAELDVEFPPVVRAGRRLANLLAAAEQPFQLVLDDLHKIANPVCLDVVDLLVRNASPTARVAVASRKQIGLALPRLRAEGRVVEVGFDDLCMGTSESLELVDRVGAAMTHDEVTQLVAGTQGWPVALYLAAKSRREGSRFDLTTPGRHPDVAAYVHAELLASLDPEEVRFLLRSSVLHRMSGPSCDAVLHTFGSQERLEAHERSNLLVHSIDGDGTWFRYHDLFRNLLRTELEQREPELVPELLRRAGHWHQVHGHLDEALAYAMAAGDTPRAADLVVQLALPTYQSGRVATLERWLSWFEDEDRLDDLPLLATIGAWLAALTGHPATAERRAAAADRARPRSRVPPEGGDVVDGQVALVHAVLCADGIDQALVDVERAARLLPVGHPWHPVVLTVLALVLAVRGDGDRAETVAIDAVAVCEDAGAQSLQAVALAEAAMVALQGQDTHRADELSRCALDVIDQHQLQDHAPAALAFAVAAHVACRTGDPDTTRALLARAQRLQPLLTHAFPHLAVLTRLEMCRSLVAVSDGAGARTQLREIREILRRRPDLGVLGAQAEELRTRLDAMPAGIVGSQSLTTAELRLLPLLQTHLTFREIGDRFFLSPNTIKTQAISVYRKLGTSSRSDAVRVAIETGLLEPY